MNVVEPPRRVTGWAVAPVESMPSAEWLPRTALTILVAISLDGRHVGLGL